MKRIVKIGFPIVCIAVLGGTLIVLKKAEKRVEEMKNYENTTKNSIQNNTSENLLSANNEASIRNKDSENVQNEISYSIPIENDEDIKNVKKQNEERVFEIVKKIYGESDDVYYTNEGMEDGKYIVAVRYKESTSAKIYYIVNLEDETAEIYY